MIHRGTYDGTIYYNPANKFCIISVKTAEKDVPEEARSIRRRKDHLIRFVATGYELPRTDAVELELDGEWKKGKYGMQLQVEQWHEIVPQTKSGVEGYLASGLIKGIGPALAKQIVSRFGVETLDILQNRPERLLEIKGITENKLEAIKTSYAESRMLQDLMTLLSPFKITPKTAQKIYQFFGPASVDILKKSPFELCQISGFGFLRVDAIVQKNGGDLRAPMRIKGALFWALEDNGGHWTMAFYQKTAGILIPAIGFDGMLQGFQIKLDIPLKNKDDPPEKPGAKYIWFSSSSKKGGTGSGSPVHLAGNPSARVVYVIEGLLKADISHCLTGRTFAAIAGANNTSPLDAMFALLAQSGTEEIIEAHDMDKYNNKMTMAGASKIYLMAQKHGMNCRRLTWNPNYKGFDDWQLALRQGSQRQKEIEKLSFKEQYLRGLCKLAHIEDCVEQWQHRAEQDIGLTEYLGLTGEEHKTFLCGGRDALAALLEPQRRKQRFVLYQLQLDEENAIPFAFKDITALKAAGYEQPPAAMYYVAGSGEIYCPAEESDDTLLKRLFADCRERLPEGCRGRPMAVSDVVELNHGAKRAYYYVSGQDQFRQVKFSPMLAKKEIPEKTQERF